MKILVTGAWRCEQEQLHAIEQMGHSIVFLQNETDSLPCNYEEIEGTICNGLFLNHSIEKFKNLRYVQLTSAGFDRMPMEYANAHGITVRNARGVYSIPMAEFSVCGVLQLYKQTTSFYESKKKGLWEKRQNVLELYKKCVCVVGCGSVGTECAKRFQAFGCTVIGVDLYPRQDEAFERMMPLCDLEEALSISDVVVLTLPLTEETRHMMNKDRFAAMKDRSVFVNVARGAVVDELALQEALNEKLLGAVLDVFEQEPLPMGHSLWKCDNAIITPHNSFVGDGNAERLFEVIKTNLEGIQ